MKAHPDLTRNEALVLNALRAGGGGPLTAYQLLDELRGAGLRAPPQVYRALKALQQQGLVHKLDSRNAFLACAGDHHAHGHGAAAVIFLLCETCERVEEVCDAQTASGLDALARRHGFAARMSSVEIRGRCAQCSGT